MIHDGYMLNVCTKDTDRIPFLIILYHRIYGAYIFCYDAGNSIKWVFLSQMRVVVA